MSERLLTTEEVAEWLNVPPAMVLKLEEQRRLLPSGVRGSTPVYHPRDVEDFIESCKPSRDSVYIVRTAVSGNVKIGIGRDVERRVAALQTANAERLILLAVIRSGGKKTERALHDSLFDWKLQGEWFEWNDHIARVVDRVKEGWPAGKIIAAMNAEILAEAQKDPELNALWLRVEATPE